MYTFVEPASATVETRPFSRPVPLTLEEEVLAAGLQVIPLERVREYQKFIKQQWEATPSVSGERYHGEWQQVPYRSIQRELNPPPDVVKDVARAAAIPGTKVHAERFAGDPFYFATRRNQPSKLEPEVVCFRFHDAPGFVA